MATAVAQVWQVASGEAPQVLPSFTGPFVAGRLEWGAVRRP